MADDKINITKLVRGFLGQAYRGLTRGFLLLRIFSMAISVSPHVLIGQRVLRSGLSWFNWRISFASDFQYGYFCESSCLFCPRFNFDFYISKIMHL